MRKEVKLGMAVGAGLIALLVVYLLVAPPSNKPGANLVTSGGNAGGTGDVAQPGDLATPEDAAQRPAIVRTETGGTGGATAAPRTETSARSDGTGGAARTGDWSMLNTGKGAPAPAAGEKSATIAKKDSEKTVTAGGSKTETPVAAAKTESAGHREVAHARPVLRDPHAAWGGGVSSDAVFGSPRSSNSAKPALISGDKPVVEASAPAAGKTHVVRSGETFSSIAVSAYGSSAYYPAIIRANPGVNPNALRLGMTINLPSIDEVKAKAPAAATGGGSAPSTGAPEPKLDASKQYKVQSGDSLHKIALKLYGKSSAANKLYEANKVAIGNDPARLKLGMVLELPEKPAVAGTPGEIHDGAPASATPAGGTTATISEGNSTGVADSAK